MLKIIINDACQRCLRLRSCKQQKWRDYKRAPSYHYILESNNTSPVLVTSIRLDRNIQHIS